MPDPRSILTLAPGASLHNQTDAPIDITYTATGSGRVLVDESDGPAKAGSGPGGAQREAEAGNGGAKPEAVRIAARAEISAAAAAKLVTALATKVEQLDFWMGVHLLIDALMLAALCFILVRLGHG